MREHEISTRIHGDPTRVWEILTDIAGYGEWSSLIPFGQGRAVPGERLELRMRGPGGAERPFRPSVLAVEPPRRLVLEASIGHRSLVHMVHSFTVAGSAPDLRLEQRWVVTGGLVGLIWPLLRRGMDRFEQFGEDLDRHMGVDPGAA